MYTWTLIRFVLCIVRILVRLKVVNIKNDNMDVLDTKWDTGVSNLWNSPGSLLNELMPTKNWFWNDQFPQTWMFTAKFHSIPPLIEYRPWTSLVFNKWQYSVRGGLSYSIILLQVATCPRHILGSRLTIVYSTPLSQTEMHYIVKYDSMLVWR